MSAIHPKPRALEAVSRAREAAYAITSIAVARRTPTETAAAMAKARPRYPLRPIDRGPACPLCDGLACKRKDSRALDCAWCGYSTLADHATFTIIGACMLANGDWPAHDGAPPSSKQAGGTET